MMPHMASFRNFVMGAKAVITKVGGGGSNKSSHLSNVESCICMTSQCNF